MTDKAPGLTKAITVQEKIAELESRIVALEATLLPSSGKGSWSKMWKEFENLFK